MNQTTDRAAKGLEVRDASRRLGDVHALRGVSLHVAPGEQVAVIGPSGAGKTTLLRAVAGFAALDSGSIRWGSECWTDGGRVLVAPRRRQIGMVAQDLALWPHLTAREHVETVLRIRGRSRPDRAAQARSALQDVGLGERLDHRPGQLSGGECQRLALARALAGGSRVLLLDEPLGQLDVELRTELAEEIRRLGTVRMTAVLHVTHTSDEALRDSDRVMALEAGEVTQCATPRDLVRAPATRFVAAVVGRSNQVGAEGAAAFRQGLGVQPHDERFGIVREGDLVFAPHAVGLAPAGLSGVVERRVPSAGRSLLRVRVGEERIDVLGDAEVGETVRLHAAHGG